MYAAPKFSSRNKTHFFSHHRKKRTAVMMVAERMKKKKVALCTKKFYFHKWFVSRSTFFCSLVSSDALMRRRFGSIWNSLLSCMPVGQFFIPTSAAGSLCLLWTSDWRRERESSSGRICDRNDYLFGENLFLEKKKFVFFFFNYVLYESVKVMRCSKKSTLIICISTVSLS